MKEVDIWVNQEIKKISVYNSMASLILFTINSCEENKTSISKEQQANMPCYWTQIKYNFTIILGRDVG